MAELISGYVDDGKQKSGEFYQGARKVALETVKSKTKTRLSS